MHDASERQFHNTTPAQQSTTPGVGVTMLATSTTAAAFAVPEGWYDRYLTLTAGSAPVWYAFGPAATPVIDKNYAGGASVTAGTLAANAEYIASRGAIDVRLDRKIHKFLHVQADSGTPTLSIRPSSQGRDTSRG